MTELENHSALYESHQGRERERESRGRLGEGGMMARKVDREKHTHIWKESGFRKI